MAPMDSAYGTAGSGRWWWYRSIASPPSRFSDACAACLRYSGRPSTYQLPSPGRRCPPLVATTTCEVSPPQEARARAMSDSLWPTSSACRW